MQFTIFINYPDLFGTRAEQYILNRGQAWKMKNVYKFLNRSVQFSLPLLHLLYAFNRFIIICHPDKIAKYCSSVKSFLFALSVLVLGMAISLQEVFDNDYMAFHGVVIHDIGSENHGHEKSTGVANCAMLLTISLTIIIFFAFFTKNINITLNTSAKFLSSQNFPKSLKRANAYIKLTHLNLALFFLNSVSMTIGLCQIFLSELFNLYANGNNSVSTSTIFISYGMAFSELILSMEIILFPIFIAIFLPTQKKMLVSFFNVIRAFVSCVH